ncbi:DnaD domain-containing protein [Lactobacillus sp. Sy-1]|uniref:DnaD domain-containing protein n=1 Tax=Lactobacillus sp. Sy-1 TaxID=2109645 RepID=UPI001C561165|nr:DnaD domain protein [Lactobacillus sp. Sy-1]MBW1605595.1 DnaD domain protein [Lactobacillus sp. Sy-1]
MSIDKFAQRLINGGQTTIANYLLDNYAKIGLNSDELVLYLQFKRFFDRGINAPDIEQISAATNIAANEIYQILHNLIQKKLMTIKTGQDQNGKDFDQYNFDLMYAKLAELSTENDVYQPVTDSSQSDDQSHGTNSMTVNNRAHVYASIEREFGRELSPIELETISGWLDQSHYSPELIELALREAVLNQVYNLKYIDRILINWEKRHVKTAADVEKELNRYQGKRNPQPPSGDDDDGPEIPIFKIK